MALKDLAVTIKDHRLTIKCARCDGTQSTGQAGGLNPEAITKRFKSFGWDCDLNNASHIVCPNCLKAKKDDARMRNNNIVGSDINMNEMSRGTAIQTNISISVIPSTRKAGLYCLKVDFPKVFEGSHYQIRQHEDAGIALLATAQHGYNAKTGIASKEVIFEQEAVCYQMTEAVSQKRLEAVMRGKCIFIDRLPDEFLPPKLRVKKTEILHFKPPVIAAAPAPMSIAPPAVNPFEGMKKINLRLSLAINGKGAKQVNMSLPRENLHDYAHARIEREGNGFRVELLAEGGNKISLNETMKERGILGLGQKHWWFPLPDSKFHGVNVPAFIDSESPWIWHVPAIPPMFDKKVDAETRAAAPISLALLEKDKKGKVRDLISQFFRDIDGTYQNNYSDGRIARECGVPVNAVIELREIAFGELNPRYVKVYEILDQIAMLEVRLAAEREHAKNGQ